MLGKGIIKINYTKKINKNFINALSKGHLAVIKKQLHIKKNQIFKTIIYDRYFEVKITYEIEKY